MNENLDKYNDKTRNYDKFGDVKTGRKRLHVDTLAELGNIGAGASSIALSKFLNRDVSMSLPYIKEIPPEDLEELILFKKELYDKDEVAVICAYSCDPNQFFLLCVIDKEDVHKLMEILFPRIQVVSAITEYTPIQLSLLKEVGSILIIHYVVALNKLLGVEHEIHAPDLKIGRLQSIVKESIEEKITLGINLNVFTIEKHISFDLSIIPIKKTVEQFLASMGVL